MQIYCMDGFNMSVIDKDEMPFAYCDEDSVEVGFPSEQEDWLLPFMERDDSGDGPTQSVYSYVPHEVVHKVIMKHGGKKDDLTNR